MVGSSLEVIDLLAHLFTPDGVVKAVDRCGFQVRERPLASLYPCTWTLLSAAPTA